jgi:signal transduction histidine kinase
MEDQIQANKLLLLGKLTASLVHEIRNPLSAIKLNLDYMKMASEELPSDINEIIGESLDAFEQINYLIEDVLDFTRKPTEKNHQITLEAVTDRCLKIISISARRKGITIQKDFAHDVPIFHANRNKLVQIFLNLINNAIEASPEKSFIIIRGFSKEQENRTEIIWEVEDFGCGIKEEDRESILQGFYTTKKDGHGIGLGVCFSLIRELHAEISFDSIYGKGTTFSIKFTVDK